MQDCKLGPAVQVAPTKGYRRLVNMATATSPVQYYGSFRDCLRSPIHKWFTYPAGYSHKLVEAKIRGNALNGDSLIADPFLGTGTTSLAARIDNKEFTESLEAVINMSTERLVLDAAGN